MATFKGILMFGDPNQTLGWSEVFYIDAGDFTEANTKLSNIAQERVKILASPVSITFARVSANLLPTTPNVRRQRNATLRRLDITGSYRPSTDKPDTAWQAAKIRMADSTQVIFRIQLLRGLSDEFWSNGDDKIAAAAFAAFLPGWTAILVANGARIKHTIRGNPNPTYPPIAITSYEGLTRRATGRPLLLPRGRRPNRPH